MAEPPKGRGPGRTLPPPIPRAPIAPAPVKTDVVRAATSVDGSETPAAGTPLEPKLRPLVHEEHSEITRNLEAPDAEELVHRMLDLVGSEAEALLAAVDGGERLADLNVRIALA